MSIAVIALIVYVERGQRRLVVQYPKKRVGNRMFGGESSHLPLKINTAGVIPPIFASSLLLLPITIAGVFCRAGTRMVKCCSRLSQGVDSPFICLLIRC